MTIEEVAAYFGSLTQACLKLGICHSNLSKWKRKGYISYLQQFRIAELTEGALMPDEADPRIEYMKRQGTVMGKKRDE